MLVSMTGFCSITEQVTLSAVGSVSLSVELKSLNGRFFEVVAKLPSVLNSVELPINTMLQEKLVRGRVFLTIRFEDNYGIVESVEPAWPLIDQYLKAAQAIKEKYHVSGDFTLTDVVSMPNVLVTLSRRLTNDDEERILALIGKAADKVMKMRKEEGERLRKDFEMIFETCASKIELVERAFHQVLEHHRELVKQALAASAATDQSTQQVEELQITLRKIDIHEEITRFKSHLASVAPLLQSQSLEKGKRLDFILQELMRETNTMMAKCAAYQVSAAGIDIKVELEKAREQILNIV